MQKVEDREGIKVDEMIYSGKKLTGERQLRDYSIKDGATIHLPSNQPQLRSNNNEKPIFAPSTPPASHAPTSSSAGITAPENPGFKTSGNNEGPLQEQFVDQSFDEDDYLIDPENHYDKLNSLEKMVIERSEHYHSDGNYQPTIRHIDRDVLLADLRCDQLFSRRLLQIAPLSNTFSPPSEGAEQSIRSAILSLGNSYLILSQILRTMNSLMATGFCGDSITVLIQRGAKGDALAEMVQIERDAILNFHVGIAETIKGILGRLKILSKGRRTAVIMGVLFPACDRIMEILGITFGDQLFPHHVLLLCRILTLVLDLGLVSYVGSHGSRFDLEYFEVDKPEIVVASDMHSKIGFVFSLRKLACLNQFLNHQQVWTFQPFSRDSLKLGPPISILTSIEAFANTWGPLWEVPAGEDFPNHIRRLNVATGYISRAEPGTECQIEDAVACHWFESSDVAPRPYEQAHESTPIERNQRMVIGASNYSALTTNKTCTYKLDDLEREYGLHMSPLDTSASSWTYDERQVGFSASQYIGITVLGTQKKLPCVTQNQAIWNKWTNQPTRANPRILNSYLGVEISRCTGNARRVKLRDLFTIESIQALINRQFPDWASSTGFGRSLESALLSDNGLAIEEIWVKYFKSRQQMAEIVCCVLEMLEKSGTSAGNFTSAFLNQNRELSMPIEPRLNNWTEFLEDSHLTAVYAIVSENCLESVESGYSVATCNDMSNPSEFTVLQTQIAVPDAVNSKNKIWLNQGGCIQRETKLSSGTQLLTWEQSRARELGGKIGKFLRSKHAIPLSREVQDDNELGGQHFRVFVRSTVPSHGGLRTRQIPKVHKPLQQKVESLDGSVPVTMRIGVPLPLQHVSL
ncbi:hypothetical protein HYALB_00001203 [Hymenoscyphus albidus]|uniref:Ubiquitin-like domain-containing protein n=1 Tax=Hymenoscyphus albidus TaxID=595503 RepID=A0A9N9Q3U8_9HELO|nr:hypothetical protein HYALB_00001203 [Hymenoscyphus albidus]